MYQYYLLFKYHLVLTVFTFCMIFVMFMLNYLIIICFMMKSDVKWNSNNTNNEMNHFIVCVPCILFEVKLCMHVYCSVLRCLHCARTAERARVCVL